MYFFFVVQETLTILCYEFPLISTVNNSDLQCARLRINENMSTSTFEQPDPSQIYIFIILDLPSKNTAPVDITIDFHLLTNVSSSIEEIRFALLVTGFNFTINNQTTTEYSPYQIPVFRWQTSTNNISDLIDILPFGNREYENDKSLCKWDSNRWNHLFNGSESNNISYGYFLKTSIPQLTFVFADMNNISLLPSPYLNVVYCIPYKLGITEIVIIVCSSVLVIIVVIILYVFHYFKGGDQNRTHHFERYYHSRQDSRDRDVRTNRNTIRHRSSVATVISRQGDQNT